MVFLPHGSADFAQAEHLRHCGSLAVCWVDEVARFELAVDIVAVDRKRGELVLRPAGGVQRVQRRTAVRAQSRLRCTVLTFVDDGIVASPATTIDLSAGGAGLLMERDADVGGTAAPPEVGYHVGLILELPDRRVGSVTEVLSVRRRASRATLRVRFSQLHPADSTALVRHVLHTQARRRW
jgi:c-di-GMP-binding flagellar brake protein YcgR